MRGKISHPDAACPATKCSTWNTPAPWPARTWSSCSPWTFAELLGLENGHEVTVGKNHLIEIQKAELGLKPLRFLAAIGDQHLQAGEKFIGFINPWQPHVGMLIGSISQAGFTAIRNLPVLGQSERDRRSRRVASGWSAANWESIRLARMAERHQDKAAAVEHMKAHNAAVIAGTTPKDRALENEQLAARGRVESALARANEQYQT